MPFGSLAQLVQSVCLTSRGSGVRIPQLPPSSANGATWKIENRVSARYTVFSFYPCTDGNKRKLLNSRRNTLERVFSAPTQSPRHSGRSIRRHLKQTAPVLTQINLAQPPAYTIFAKIFRCKSASFSGAFLSTLTASFIFLRRCEALRRTAKISRFRSRCSKNLHIAGLCKEILHT